MTNVQKQTQHRLISAAGENEPRPRAVPAGREVLSVSENVSEAGSGSGRKLPSVK